MNILCFQFLSIVSSLSFETLYSFSNRPSFNSYLLFPWGSVARRGRGTAKNTNCTFVNSISPSSSARTWYPRSFNSYLLFRKHVSNKVLRFLSNFFQFLSIVSPLPWPPSAWAAIIFFQFLSIVS